MSSCPVQNSYLDPDSFNRCYAIRHKQQSSLFHLNAQSLKNKKDSVDMLLQELNHNFDLLAFTETWFLDDWDTVHFTGYRCASMCRSNMRGGGVAIYVKENVHFTIVR